MATVEQVKSKVQSMLQKHGSVTIDSDGDFVFEWGSSAVFIRIIDWGEGDILVNIFSVVVRDIPITGELCEDLLTTRAKTIGAWSIERDPQNSKVGNLMFSTRILGNNLDEDELVKSIQLTGFVADEEDDQLVARYGGSRLLD